MSTQFNQGAEANHAGQRLEDLIESEFIRRKIPVFEYDPTKINNQDWVSDSFVVKNAPYKSIYGCNSRSEFLYRDCRRLSDIRIECRSQDVAGSVDEKLPYLFMNAVEAMPEKEIWFVMSGDGAREAALNWLRRRCAQEAAKTLLVLEINEAWRRIKALKGRGG